MQLNSSKKTGRSTWITGIGLAYCLMCFFKVTSFIDFRVYEFMFVGMDPNFVRFRFAGSIILRVIGIAMGIGILLRKEPFRKIALIYAGFTILTVLVKHPLQVFIQVAGLNEGLITLETPKIVSMQELTNASIPILSWCFFVAFDVIFSGLVLILFTRPAHKAHFH